MAGRRKGLDILLFWSFWIVDFGL